MPLAHPRAPFHCLAVTLLLVMACAAALSPAPALASFHLNQINKIMAGYEGDEALDAVEMEMLSDGENLVSGGSLKVYNGAGVLIATLGTFGANLPASGAFAGRKILFATMKWKQKFGLTPDLQISAGIPKTTGQVSFENAGCLVNAIAYGGVSVFLNGTTAAPPLPILGATALDRGINGNGIFPSCPLGENAGARFTVVQGYPGNVIRFTNNSGAFVDVTSTVTGVEPTTTPAPRPLRASPNPFQRTTDIEFTSAPGRVLVHDVRGRLVRSWEGLDATGRIHWDGTDARGRDVASGIYFVRTSGTESRGAEPLRVVLLR